MRFFSSALLSSLSSLSLSPFHRLSQGEKRLYISRKWDTNFGDSADSVLKHFKQQNAPELATIKFSHVKENTEVHIE